MSVFEAPVGNSPNRCNRPLAVPIWPREPQPFTSVSSETRPFLSQYESALRANCNGSARLPAFDEHAPCPF